MASYRATASPLFSSQCAFVGVLLVLAWTTGPACGSAKRCVLRGTLGVVLRGLAAARARWGAKPNDRICRRGVQTPRLGRKANQLGAAYDRPGKRKPGSSVFSTRLPTKRRPMGGSD